jgi:hypothetical protein
LSSACAEVKNLSAGVIVKQNLQGPPTNSVTVKPLFAREKGAYFPLISARKVPIKDSASAIQSTTSDSENATKSS